MDQQPTRGGFGAGRGRGGPSSNSFASEEVKNDAPPQVPTETHDAAYYERKL